MKKLVKTLKINKLRKKNCNLGEKLLTLLEKLKSREKLVKTLITNN